MLQNIYLLNFNQYYNRIVKGQNLKTISDYNDYIEAGPFTAINFNPSDGINTAHTLNISETDLDKVDYFIVVDEISSNVISRWFIIQTKRELGGQYTLSLRRDILVDYYQQVINSTAYIEKAMINSIDNKLIYNSEEISVNQIKTSETLLWDTTHSAYVVAYIAKNYEGGLIEAKSNDIASDYSYSKNTIQNNYEGKVLIGKLDYVEISFDARYSTKAGSTTQSHAIRIYNTRQTEQLSADIVDSLGIILNVNNQNPNPGLNTIAQEFSNINTDSFETASYSYLNPSTLALLGFVDAHSEIDTLKEMAGEAIDNIDDDTLFTYKLDRVPNPLKIETKLPVNSGLYNEVSNYIKSMSNITFVESMQQSYNVNFYFDAYKLNDVETVSGAAVKMTIPTELERIGLTDAPYDMLCIPCTALLAGKPQAHSFTYSTMNTAVNIGQAIATALGGTNSFCYDVQLLPYCPCLEYYGSNSFSLSKLTENVHYSLITDKNDNVVGAGFWCSKSSFTAKIPRGVITDPYTGYSGIGVPKDPIEFKVRDACDKYRIVSPNYAGAFDISATKNNGIKDIEVNCTYKPLQPYIHINPVFGGLYGGDFNDNRGLICGGDFSLPVVNDAWTNYQIQNKSYRESFDRQIENMETKFNISMEQQKIGAVIGTITGTVAGAASGAMAGGMGGNVIGAGVGAGVGAVASLAANIAGAAADVYYAQRLQNESMSYTKDMFNYNLQNIQALPNTMSRTSAFDINNKIFPFIEFYTCTDVEKEAIRNKIKYNGMTVMTIGTIGDYTFSNEGDAYIQAQLIRFPQSDIAVDYHMVAEISNELHKGVYIK